MSLICLNKQKTPEQMLHKSSTPTYKEECLGSDFRISERAIHLHLYTHTHTHTLSLSHTLQAWDLFGGLGDCIFIVVEENIFL